MFYNKTREEIVKELGTDIDNGLTDSRVHEKRKQYGENKISRTKKENWFTVLVEQFKSPIYWILGFSVIISSFISFYEYKDLSAEQINLHKLLDIFSEPIVIFALTFANFIIEFVNDLNALKAIQKISKMNAIIVKVIRNGNVVEISSDELVVGDIIHFESGNAIKADIRIIESINVTVSESAITGESDEVEKNDKIIKGKNSSIQDQHNMLFNGTFVTNGNGLGIVVKTGLNSYLGSIVKDIDSIVEEDSTLDLQMKHLTRRLFFIAISASLLTLVLTVVKGFGIKEIFDSTLAIMIGMIPEGLPTVLTIVLTLTSLHLVKEHAILKDSDLIESLGQVDIFCTDKTGTITTGKMVVREFYNHKTNKIIKDTSKDIAGLSQKALLSLNVLENEEGEFFGSPTEVAIANLLKGHGLTKDILEEKLDIVKELPFSSKIKMSGVTYKENKSYYALFIGAYDFLESAIKKTEHAAARKALDKLSKQGLRVITLTQKKITQKQAEGEITDNLNNLELVGFFGIMDPLKDNISEIVPKIRKAGVKIVLITGDYKETAKRIAFEAKIIDSIEKANVMTGEELDQISDKDFDLVVEKVDIFARVRPDHKVKIISSLQRDQRVVAMTGDGVNDSIALKKSNIGIVMGMNGSQISKDSGDLILLDDDFDTIYTSIKRGRIVFENIRKFLRQMLTDNNAIASTLLLSLLFLRHEILSPLMVLWINAFSDSIPSVTLGFDEPDHDIMSEPPRKSNEKILTKSIFINTLVRGISIGAMTFVANVVLTNLNYDIIYSNTFSFVLLSFGQLIHLFDVRSKNTIYKRNPFSNKKLLFAVGMSVLLNLCLVFSPINYFVGLTSISIIDLFLAIILGAIPTLTISLFVVLKNNKKGA